MSKLNQEERELLTSVERGEWRSVKNLERERARYRGYARATFKSDPAHATLFKRRAAALAVRRLLGRGIRVIQCTTRRRKGLRVPVLQAKSGRRQESVQG